MAAAAADDSSGDHHFLHVESLPLVDLRFLSQSELYSLSLSSSSHISRPHHHDASLIPKIDRSVFNESAGSRKQTFSKLRLAPRNSQSPPLPLPLPPIQIPRQNDLHTSQIISLLQSLFGVKSSGADSKNNDIIINNSNTPTGYYNNSLVPVQVDSFQDSLLLQGSASVEPRRKRGRPRKNGVLVLDEDPFGVELKRRTQALGTESSSAVVMRRDVAKRKSENGGGSIVVVEEKGKEEEVVVGEAVRVVNYEGVPVDVAALVNVDVEDLFGEELRRRTQGLQSEGELLEFMGRLNGEWASQRKKRRIVQAGDFCDVLPRGWKIMLALKRRAGHVWIICHSYISPDGRQFMSCKEISSYLLSCCGSQDINNLESSRSGGSQQLLGNMMPENGIGLVPTNDVKAVNISSNLLNPSASVSTGHANLAILSPSIGSVGKNISDENVHHDLVSDRSLIFNEQPLKGNQNDKTAVQNFDEVNDVAFRSDAPLDVRNFSNYESNSVKCMESGVGNVVDQDGNARCPETISYGNAQPLVNKCSGHELPVRLVYVGEQVDFGSSKLPPNFQEKRRAADGLIDVNIRHERPFENDRWLTNSGNCDSETVDVLNSFKLPGSSESFSAVHSHVEPNNVGHNSINSIDGLNVDPNVKVVREDNDDHASHNEDAVTSFALDMSSSNEQSFGCQTNSSLCRSIEKKLVVPVGDEPPFASNNNSDIVSSGTLDVSCNNDAAVDAYSTTNIIMGRSDGCASNPVSGCTQNKFQEQGRR